MYYNLNLLAIFSFSCTTFHHSIKVFHSHFLDSLKNAGSYKHIFWFL